MKHPNRFLIKLYHEDKWRLTWFILTILFLVWTFATEYYLIKIIFPIFCLLYLLNSYLIAKEIKDEKEDRLFDLSFCFSIGLSTWWAFVGMVWWQERSWNPYSTFIVFGLPSYGLLITPIIYLGLYLFQKNKEEGSTQPDKSGNSPPKIL